MEHLRLTQVFNEGICFAPDGEAVEAVYQSSPSLPKPCVHPMKTPARVTLSGFEMSDHVWHRGLWFTIKFINGTNFWEEHEPYGIQRGRAQPRVELTGHNAATVTHGLDWISDATGLVIQETRRLHFSAIGDVRQIDWTTELRAMKKLTLDRTPFTTWGGYGGLIYRGSRELHDVNFEVSSGEKVNALTGERHDWCLMNAAVDGGPKRRVSIGMIDHPDNPRSPTPWYGKGSNGYTFMNAAFLFHEPMEVPEGKVMKMRYRVAWRDGAWEDGAFAALADQFRRNREPSR